MLPRAHLKVQDARVRVPGHQVLQQQEPCSDELRRPPGGGTEQPTRRAECLPSSLPSPFLSLRMQDIRFAGSYKQSIYLEGVYEYVNF